MIGVVVPAHNEAALLPACLRALRRAARHPALQREAVGIVVVADACTDDTASIATRHRTHALRVDARNVGQARAAGAAWLVGQGARWLAFTDADSVVAPDWLAAQLRLQAEAVCGTVAVADWSPHSAEVRARHDARYVDADGHRHVHGANLGVCAQAYLRAGGFAPLAVGEDVALVQALQQVGARLIWSAAPRVTTSARRDPRARGGFGDHLLGLQQDAP